MEVKIEKTTAQDIQDIFKLYDEAIAYQKEVGNNHWLGFETAMIEKEIVEDRHFKVISDKKIISTFCTTISDPLIWKDSDLVQAVYIHRIATSKNARGNNVLKNIISYAIDYAKDQGLQYIRMDTGSGNDRLIGYYIKNGFTFMGDIKVNYTPDLPAHYKDGSFALLQMSV
jgi:ribosomal protein S18 acetylase RimI-like enzyme